ncbi:MAG: MATE family efflux transporter [Simkania sp.]|nr:MATE family efflux transporter [Simkania sp.]MCP5490461.1 MATE family efflux transporter [Chlamydiales bacterium]
MTTSENVEPQISPLSSYPLGSFRELLALSTPLVFSCLSASLLGFCDRLFLSHYSLDAWNAASTSGYIAFLYQMMLSVIAMIAQSFIAQHIGAKRPSNVGPIVWQMIWFAFLSMFITYPSSFFAEMYFRGTEIEAPALAYFRPMALFNFLFPLNAALSAFFIGRGKTRIIFYANISIQFMNIALDYLLIYGVGSIIPPMGTFGAALATIISEATLCLILFSKFARPEYIPTYNTHQRKLNLSLLKEMLKVGIPRSIGRGMAISAWSFAAHLLVMKGGIHLLVLTLGTSLFMIFTFINEGVCQALTTVASHIFGAKEEQAISRLLRSAFQVLALSMLLLSVPLIVMREQVISLFISDSLPYETLELLKKTCIFAWIACLANGINFIGASFITASRDTFFYACIITMNWVTICVPVYLIIGRFGVSPEYFFTIDSVNTILFGIIYFFRFRKGVWKKNLLSLHHPIEA